MARVIPLPEVEADDYEQKGMSAADMALVMKLRSELQQSGALPRESSEKVETGDVEVMIGEADVAALTEAEYNPDYYDEKLVTLASERTEDRFQPLLDDND